VAHLYKRAAPCFNKTSRAARAAQQGENQMKRIFIENEVVTVEIDGNKKCYATFVDAAEAIGQPGYEAAEAIATAVEANGEYEAA
jgi:hypothetical protein